MDNEQLKSAINVYCQDIIKIEKIKEENQKLCQLLGRFGSDYICAIIEVCNLKAKAGEHLEVEASMNRVDYELNDLKLIINLYMPFKDLEMNLRQNCDSLESIGENLFDTTTSVYSILSYELLNQLTEKTKSESNEEIKRLVDESFSQIEKIIDQLVDKNDIDSVKFYDKIKSVSIEFKQLYVDMQQLYHDILEIRKELFKVGLAPSEDLEMELKINFKGRFIEIDNEELANDLDSSQAIIMHRLGDSVDKSVENFLKNCVLSMYHDIDSQLISNSEKVVFEKQVENSQNKLKRKNQI